jgi:tetratricopeptide (TPR) repeat protein
MKRGLHLLTASLAAALAFGVTLYVVRFVSLPLVPWLARAASSDQWTVASSAASLVATGVAAAILRVGREHRAHPAHQEPQLPRNFDAQLVRTITNPYRLGVHRARAADESGTHLDDAASLPPYVARTFDPKLRDMLGGSRFVLLVGDAAAGKSRSAFQAVAAVLPRHMLVAPRDRGSVEAAIQEALRYRDCVLWLDGLTRLAGPEGLTDADVSRLLAGRKCHRVIVATVTSSDLAKFTNRNDGATRDINREVLSQAQQIRVPRMFDEEELRRARLLQRDPRIGEALGHPQYGLPEYIAAGPELFDRWQTEALGGGEHARGAALISAAVACVRAGLIGAIPASLVERLHSRYLQQRGGKGAGPESLQAAWRWATEAGRIASALSIDDSSGTRRVEVFGYLVDECDRRATPAEHVSDGTLEAALGEASATEAMRIGQTARDYGRYRIALAAFTQAAEDRRRRLGESERNTLVSRNKMARARRALGMLTEALAEHEDILRIQLENGPRDDRDTLTTRDNVARTKRALGFYAEAEAEHRAVLAARSGLLGPDHAETLTSANNHARALVASGEYAEGEAEHRAVLAARSRVLSDADSGVRGDLNPDTLTSRNDHARALYRLNRLAEAEAGHKAAYQSQVQVLGAEHPDTLVSLNDLARVHLAMGEVALAFEECTAALNARTRLLGPDHHDTLNSRNDLARISLALGLPGDAEAGHRAAFGARSHALGPRHPETLVSLADLAVTHAVLGRHAEALEECDRALEGLTAALGFEHPIVGRVRGEREDIQRRLDQMMPASELPGPPGARTNGYRRMPVIRRPARLVSSPDIATIDGHLPRVQEITNPALLAGPARLPARAGGSRGTATPYVLRDFDGPLRRALGGSGFVLLIGDAVTGKSRSAFEAMSAVLPDHYLIAPRRRGAVGPAVDLAAAERRSVLWIDDLYELAGPDGLTRGQVARLIGDPACHRLIIACISHADLRRFTDLSDSAARQTNREAIELAHRFAVDREWSDNEMLRLTHRTAALSADHPLVRQAAHRDLTRRLVAADEVLSTWRSVRADASARGPVVLSAALISAAVDCRRAGMSNPLSRRLLSRIHHAYLPPDYHLAGNDLEAAWELATAPDPITAALTVSQRRRTSEDDGETYLDVFSYLVDERDREAGTADQVPSLVLYACLAEAEAAEAMRIGQVASNYGLYRIALDAFAQAARDRSRRLGPEDPDTLASRDKEARALRFLGELSRAEALHAEVTEIQQRVLGSTDHATLTSRDNRARVLRVLKRLAEAEAEHQAVLAIRASLLGAENADTLTSRNNLARVWQAMSRRPAAEREFRTVAAARARVLGDGHRDTLTSLDDLASVLAESGQLAEAAEIYERVVAGRTSLLGPAHARTAASAEALAKVRRDLGGEPDPGSGADRQDPSEQALDSGRPVVAGGRPDEARDPVTAAGTMEPEAGNPSRPAPADHTSAGGRPAARSSATGSSAAGQAVATRVIRLVRHLAARYSALP